MRRITLAGLVGISMLLAAPADAQQLPIPAGAVSNPNRVISIYNTISNGQRIGQVTSDVNGYFEMTIPYPATTDPDDVLIYAAYDTGAANIPSFGIAQTRTPPTDFADGLPGKLGYLTGMYYTGPGGVFKIKGRAIAFPNGTYALYSCLPWLGYGTYCDANVTVGWFNPGNITQLPKVPKTRSTLDTDVGGTGAVVPRPITPLSNPPKPRIQVAAENDENAPKARQCDHLKLRVIDSSNVIAWHDISSSCSFSIPNFPIGVYVVMAEVTETIAGASVKTPLMSKIFRIDSSGMMNGNVAFNNATQKWVTSQIP